MVVALISLFISLGGVSFGAAVVITGKSIKNNTVATKDLKNNDIRGKDVRSNTLRGSDIVESSLSEVPSATHADSADSATNATTAQNATQLGGTAASGYAKTAYEGVHLVGAAGEPAFGAGWSNFGGGFSPAGFYKDSLGIVHLQGLVNTGGGSLAFTLPEGYRPSTQHYQIIAEGGAGEAHVTIATNGGVNVFNYAGGAFVSLEYINFKVGT
jgi:hypothetical protein